MIKFFRRIRQALLRDNRYRKYLLYALGEIALVMIGILLALQVNNWNENRMQRNLEHAVLAEMKENLKNDLGDIRRNIVFDSSNHAATLHVLTHLENNIPFTDSLAESYGKLGWASLFAENTSAFENLKAIGFNLISNEELRGEITFLYSTRYEYLNEILNRYNDTQFDQFRPILQSRTSSKTGDFFTRQPNDTQELRGDLEFKEVLREDLFSKQFFIQLNRNIEKEVVDLISLIDKEIM